MSGVGNHKEPLFLKSRINLVEMLPDGTVKKTPGLPFIRGTKIFSPKKLLQEEIAITELFSGTQGFPIIIEKGPAHLLLANAGEVITKHNCPSDAKKQLLKISQELTRHAIIHRDIKAENLLVKNGIITLIDFGWAIKEGTPYSKCPRELTKGIDRRLVYDNEYALLFVIEALYKS